MVLVNLSSRRKRCWMRAQVSLESLILMGFVLTFSIPLLMLVGNLNTEDAAIGQARSTVQILADAANQVYMQGEGAQKVVLVAYPPRLIGAAVRAADEDHGEIVFTVRADSGPVDVVRVTVVPLDETGSDLTGGRLGAGLQKVKISYIGGKVRLEVM
ncbi:hypothetical protein J7K41_04270 [Candidatus Micrarchaeota archaeon]|nr:hypothetical protein [Candidatus Micrarchaeota archaeon]